MRLECQLATAWLGFFAAPVGSCNFVRHATVGPAGNFNDAGFAAGAKKCSRATRRNECRHAL